MSDNGIERRRTKPDDGWAWCLPSGEWHREDGPAVEWDDGSIGWYLNDEEHRVDGPAIVAPDRNGRPGYESWHLHGREHRVGGPAFRLNDGSKEFWFVNDQLHREDGPAEVEDGKSSWYWYGQLHRLDGPAREHPDGSHEWFVQGARIPDGQTAALDELLTCGASETLTHVLSMWRPDGPTAAELADAVRAATL